MKTDRDYLFEASRRILANDPRFAEEARSRAGDKLEREKIRGIGEAIRNRRAVEEGALPESTENHEPVLALETIVLKIGRPVLLVQNGIYHESDPMLGEAGSVIWKERLFRESVLATFRQRIPSVGRVEVWGNADYEWLGTAWLVESDIAVTNRHVAKEFAHRKGAKFLYRKGFPEGMMKASVDFLEEHGISDEATLAVIDILYVADADGPDIALLKLERPDGARFKNLSPLRLARKPATPKDFVATIGYPAADSRVPDQDLVKKFFGDIYNKKRFAPGQVIQSLDDLLTHDCSTLGGNSGSCVLGLNGGEVLGLHFSGLFLRENRAVPANVIADVLDKVKRGVMISPGEIPAIAPQPQTPAVTDGNKMKFTLQVPVELTLSLGVPVVADPAAAAAIVPAAAVPASVDDAVRQVRERIAGSDAVLEVRKGYSFQDGWITDREAVVVVLADSTARASVVLPSTVCGCPVEIRDPGLAELFPRDFNAAAEGVRPTAYQPPPGFSLKEVNQEMKVICHLSPDAGWPQLARFLEPTGGRLTMGIYDFTAPHVVAAVLDAVKDDPKTFMLVMQEGESMKEGSGIKGDDIREKEVIEKFSGALGDRFSHVAASVGKDAQFASSYHIKVIVRDGSAFWLSSGNLQSSNQYQTAPEEGSQDWWHLENLNREWNIIIENEALAVQYEEFLRHDFENAAAQERVVSPVFLDIEEAGEEKAHAGVPTYFQPLEIQRKVRVMPLLTPDNYQQRVLKLIEGAEEQILFQNQSLNLQGVDNSGNDKNDQRFQSLYMALLEKQRQGLDVRIIMRGDFNPQTYVERLKGLGFDMSRVRLQNHCHTKGIVVDRKKVLVGSHNWTNEGALVNRDASLIFHDEEIAGYFSKVFWFDWKNLARQSVGRPRRVRRVNEAGNESPPGAAWNRVTLESLVF